MAAQTLFSDFPTTAVPGMVSPNISADVQPTPVSIQDQAAAYNLQQKMKKDREAEWARAAAANSRLGMAVDKLYNQSGHYLPSTISQSNPRQWGAIQPGGSSNSFASPQARQWEANQPSGGMPGYSGPVLWAPPGLTGPQLGSWSEKQQKIAMEQNKQPPLILQNYQR